MKKVIVSYLFMILILSIGMVQIVQTQEVVISIRK